MLNLGAGGVVAKAANRFFTGHGVLFQSPCGLGVGSVLLHSPSLDFFLCCLSYEFSAQFLQKEQSEIFEFKTDPERDT